MNLLKRILVTTAGAAMAAGLMAGTADAATTLQPGPVPPVPASVTATAYTWVTNPAVPGNGGTWATDSVLRTATISGGYRVPSSYCGQSHGLPAACYAYTATLRDKGTFRSYRHALTPNQDRPGRRIFGIVDGSVYGTASFRTFYANATPNASLVPRWSYSGFNAAATWPELFFPHGTSFSGLNINPWSVTYSARTACGPQHWTDASYNGHGNFPWDGNITGCRYLHHHWVA